MTSAFRFWEMGVRLETWNFLWLLQTRNAESRGRVAANMVKSPLPSGQILPLPYYFCKICPCAHSRRRIFSKKISEGMGEVNAVPRIFNIVNTYYVIIGTYFHISMAIVIIGIHIVWLLATQRIIQNYHPADV